MAIGMTQVGVTEGGFVLGNKCIEKEKKTAGQSDEWRGLLL